MRKVNQKPISFKIDESSLARLDSLCSEYGIKRNSMLNVLCKIGIENLSGHRSHFHMLLTYGSIQF